ncbi:MAG TPA: acyl-CoA desaturase, partial [Aequorivita sp.]|nr:acyl-CoA desaturase [Aequorivita sp.]
MTYTNLNFSRVDSAKFFRTLNRRVNDYFKENNIARTGNWKLHLKTIVMFSLYLTPYFLLLTLDFPGWAQLLFTIVMGVGMAGVGMNVMHDANHGSYSSKKWINK